MSKLLILLFFFILTTEPVNAQFGPQRVISNAVGAGDTFAADIDGDGDFDVLSVSFFDSTIAWYENLDGLGYFGPKKIIVSGHDLAYAPSSIIAHDFDLDGDMDIAYGTVHGESLVWFENIDGAGNFQLKQIISGEGRKFNHLHGVDIDYDGDIDILTSNIFNAGENSFRETRLYENENGIFTFKHIISDEQGSSVSTADLDNDGYEDVIYSGNGIFWKKNINGSGIFGEEQTLGIHENINDFDVIDINGDGNLDIVFAIFVDDTLGWYKNNNNGHFELQTITENLNAAFSVGSFDFDNDGDNDIVVASGLDNIIICYENMDGNGSFQETQIIDQNIGVIYDLKNYDIDSDGRNDLLYAEETFGYIAWHKNTSFLNLYENQFGMQIDIFPNPTNNWINIYSKNKILDIKIFDASGKFLKEFKNQNRLNIENYTSGTYFLKITDTKGLIIKKTIIKK